MVNRLCFDFVWVLVIRYKIYFKMGSRAITQYHKTPQVCTEDLEKNGGGKKSSHLYKGKYNWWLLFNKNSNL